MPAPLAAVASVLLLARPTPGGAGWPGARPLPGATTGPAVTVCDAPKSITCGDQPRFAPLMAWVAPSEKSVVWPDTFQPTLPARVSVTVIGFSEPLVVSSEPAGFSVGDGNVTLRLSTLMTSEPASTVVVMSSDAVTPVNGVTVSGTPGDCDGT